MIKVHLPWPPSQNHIWRRGKGRTYRDPKYIAWLEESAWILAQQRPKIQPIVGNFRAEIQLHPPDNRQRDIDNSVKVLLDMAQKYGLVANDRYCTQLVVSRSGDETIPVGALLTLTPVSS